MTPPRCTPKGPNPTGLRVHPLNPTLGHSSQLHPSASAGPKHPAGILACEAGQPREPSAVRAGGEGTCWQIACHKPTICHPFPRAALFIYVRARGGATAGGGIKQIPSHRNKFQQREAEWEIAEGVNSVVFSLTPGSITLLNADRRRVGFAKVILSVVKYIHVSERQSICLISPILRHSFNC